MKSNNDEAKDYQVIHWTVINRNLQLLAITLSVLAPALLTAGYSYYLGMLAAYGLDASLFDRGFADAIAESWYMVVLLFLYLWKFKWWATGYIALLFLIAVIVIILVARKRARGERIGFIDDPVTRDNPGRTICGVNLWGWKCILSSFGDAFHAIFWFVSVVVVLLTVSIIPYGKAQVMAKETIGRFKVAGCNPILAKDAKYTCVQLIDFMAEPENELIAGLLVVSDAKRVAIYAEGGVEVWPLRDGYKVRKIIVD